MPFQEMRIPNYFDANIRHEKEDEGGLILLTRILEFFSSSHFQLSLEQNPIHEKKIKSLLQKKITAEGRFTGEREVRQQQ